MVLAHFPPTVGGTERQAQSLAASPARVRHRVTVLTLSRTGVPAREIVDGVAVKRALTGRGRGVSFGATYLVSLLRHLGRPARSMRFCTRSICTWRPWRRTG